MLSILINAYACSPYKGSEPGMSWNWITQIAKYCHVYVITEGEWKEEIEASLLKLDQGKNMKFYYNPVSENVRKMCWNQGDWRFYYYYYKWQKETLNIALNIVQNYKIDVIHQLNMIGYREPGYLWKIKGIPFVWGPIGGFGDIPLSYLSLFKGKEVLMRILKNIINNIQVYQPKIQKAIHKADLILAANSVAQKTLQKFRIDKVILFNEAASTISKRTRLKPLYESSEFNIVWIGRNLTSKALPLALDTLLKLNKQNIILHVIGIDEKDVVFRTKVKQTNVIFHPWMSHKEVQIKLSQCQLFLFTSLFEGTPHVVLESLSNGIPVICHDICGQGDIVNESCGIKIPIINPKLSINGFSEAIEKLYDDRKLLKSLSDGAIKRAKELTWENKTFQLISYYEKITNK